MLRSAAVYATTRTQLFVTLSTTEAEYVALADGAMEEMFVRSVMSFMQPNVYQNYFDGRQRGGQGNCGKPP